MINKVIIVFTYFYLFRQGQKGHLEIDRGCMEWFRDVSGQHIHIVI